MKARLAVFAVVALIAVAALAAPAAAHGAFPAMNKACVTYDLEKGYWTGSISGAIRGTFQMTGLDYTYPSEIVYTESFAITGRDATMEGYVIGIYPDPAFSATGWVTGATGRWSKMQHWMMCQSGKVTESGDTYVARSQVFFLPSPLDD
jgi:hypothetical protein